MKELDFRKIVERLRTDGSVCGRYRGVVLSASTKSALMQAVSTSQGVEFITSRLSDDIHMDYASVAKELSAHINGERVFECDGYTTEIYIGYAGDVLSRTSLLALWGCHAHLTVPDNRAVTVFCDAASHLDIECGRNARVGCVYYGETPSGTGYGNIHYVKGEQYGYDR